MKLWRPGITGKLFLAIFATCIVLLISMHWAVRISFERGFIDYIKRGNEQRLTMLSDALSEQYAQHGSWAFLRNNDRFIFQLLRTFERDNDDRSPPGHAMKPDAAPNGPPPDGPPDGPRPRPEMPPHGWRTMFWVVDQSGRVLVGPRERVPEDGTQRSIVVNGAEVGKVIASPVERLTRNTDINFDRQQKRTSWLIVALATLLAALATFPLARGLLAPVKRLVEGTHKLAAGDFSTRVTVTGGDELGRLAQDFNQLASTLERNQQMRRDLMADISHELRTPLAVLRGELEAIQDGVRRFTPESIPSLQAEVATLTKLVDDLHQLSMSDEGGAGLPENLTGYHHPAGSGGGRFSRALRQPAAKHSGVAPGAGDDLRRPRPPDAALQQSAGEQPALYRQRRQPAHHRPPQRPDAGD
ncbi:signal transduction histidine-protein kinase BaeS [Klebsiella pneumoniae subsp. ozaenae]|uniref:histidine kinase n=1 Tax=Klebsiella pneumoniae subsp. ozaenae TaxID=574 RepID=A0A378A2R0_KLEPO|nr:signal transduction histidine-protein kinase BaeS [Klebsiella pneumoniae subsp. ozaenae]